MPAPRRRATAGAVLALSLIASAGAPAAPGAELWARWTRHGPAGAGQVDHSAWDGLLRTYVRPGPDGVNRLRYAELRTGARRLLEDYLARLQGSAVSGLGRDEQRAFWINLYNALTVKVVVDHYPVASIRDIDISPGLFADGPWGAKLARVEGEALSLDDIEHRILRPIWTDPRIHYAVNCASLGCPDLMPEAFTAANTERLLEAGARRYVNHPRGVTLDGGRLVVSSIYEWFKADFGGDDAGVIAHLKRYAGPDLRAALAGITSIDDDRYDWSLNDAP